MKYYGVFKVTVDTYDKYSFKKEKLRLAKEVIEDRYENMLFVRSKNVYDDKKDSALVREVCQERHLEAYGAKFSRGPHRFKTRVFVHEVDEQGFWKPTRAELREVGN